VHVPLHHSTLPSLFFFSCYADHPHLHSFPTRRSSDLNPLRPRWPARDDSSSRCGRTLPAAGHRQAAARTLPREARASQDPAVQRSEEHTSELQSRSDLVCRLLLEKKKKKDKKKNIRTK